MKQCINKQLLSRLIDNDLPSEKKTQVENHLGQCEKCRAVYNSYRAAGAVIRSFESEAATPVFIRCNSRIIKPLHERFLNMRIALSFASVLVVILVFNLFLITDTMFTGYKTVPVLSQNSSFPLMNTLLGSFVYYEKMDSDIVESQFFKLSPGVADTVETEAAVNNEYYTYNSPLFSDNSDDIAYLSDYGY